MFTSAEYNYDDRKARDCEGNDQGDLAPDDYAWDAHEYDFDVLWERIEAKFDFDECGYPLTPTVPVVLDRAEAEREAARLGRILPPGTPIIMLMIPELVSDGVCYPDRIDEEWWPDGIPAEALLRYPTNADNSNAVDWDRTEVTK